MSGFVTVPFAAGIPPVARAANQIVTVLSEAMSDLTSFGAFLAGPQWGIFDSDGNPAIVGDSVKSQEFNREWRISSYPVEPNGFRDYNKVEVPYEIVMTFMQGGSVSDRDAFLVSVDSVCASLDLFSAVSPEATYPSVNPYRYDYRREVRDGCTLLKVNVHCEKIRTTASSQFGNPSDPSTADASNGGNVQAGDPGDAIPPGTAFG